MALAMAYEPQPQLWKSIFQIRNFLPNAMLFRDTMKVYGFTDISFLHTRGSGLSISLETQLGTRPDASRATKPTHLCYSLSLSQATQPAQLTSAIRTILSTKAHQELQVLKQHLYCLTLNRDAQDNDIMMALVLPQIKVFGWLLSLNRILMIDNLNGRGWSMVNMCVLFREAEESVHHIFNTCRCAQALYTWLTTQSQNALPQLTTTTYTASILCSSIPKNQRSGLLIKQFILWRERCSRIFRETIKGIEELGDEVMVLTRSTESSGHQ